MVDTAVAAKGGQVGGLTPRSSSSRALPGTNKLEGLTPKTHTDKASSRFSSLKDTLRFVANTVFLVAAVWYAVDHFSDDSRQYLLDSFALNAVGSAIGNFSDSAGSSVQNTGNSEKPTNKPETPQSSTTRQNFSTPTTQNRNDSYDGSKDNKTQSEQHRSESPKNDNLAQFRKNASRSNQTRSSQKGKNEKQESEKTNIGQNKPLPNITWA